MRLALLVNRWGLPALRFYALLAGNDYEKFSGCGTGFAIKVMRHCENALSITTVAEAAFDLKKKKVRGAHRWMLGSRDEFEARIRAGKFS